PRGHTALLYRDYFLFTGDHLWWSRNRRALNASQGVCWYDWDEQRKSIALLSNYEFQWVLPGHGERARLDPAEARRQIEALATRMRAASAAVIAAARCERRFQYRDTAARQRLRRRRQQAM